MSNVKPRGAIASLLVMSSLFLTACDDDDFSYFASFGGGLFTFVIGNTADGKAESGEGAPAMPSGSSTQSVEMQGSIVTDTAVTGTVAGVTHYSDMPLVSPQNSRNDVAAPVQSDTSELILTSAAP